MQLNKQQLNRLHARMVREIDRHTSHTTGINSDCIYISLKKEQISQRYLKLMQATRRKKLSF